MPFDELNRGDPFSGDFPGRSDLEPWNELNAAVQRQVTELSQRRSEPAIRHALLRSLQQRRRVADGAPQAVTPFDFLPAEAGFDTLLARGELLITGQSYDGRFAPVRGWEAGQYAREYLEALGMAADELTGTGLEGRVVRLTHPDLGPQELADLARALRNRGFTASLCNMTPTAPVIKSMGGPKPAPAPGPFRPADDAGTGVRVAIIDTGIADQPRTDGWLHGIHGGIDPLDTCPQGGDGYLDFDAGHGTFIAGIVQQIAPGAQITAYRAVHGDGIGSEVAVASELIRAVRQDGAQIVNLSLGCQTHDNVPPIALQAALEIITEWERETGNEVVIVAAAGNYGDAIPCWPAAFRRVLSVAGLTADLRPAAWSSRGFWVACSTIAEGLSSTFVEGREPPLTGSPPESFAADAWAVWSGTSFAAAQVTGALARLRESHGYSPRQALSKLLAAGRPVPDFGQAVKILPGM